MKNLIKVFLMALVLFGSNVFGETANKSVVVEKPTSTKPMSEKLTLQVLAGRRWLKFEDTGVQGSQEVAATALYIIEDLPFGIGPSTNFINFRNEDLGSTNDTSWGCDLGLSAMAWVDIKQSWTPYVKLRYVLASSYKFEYDNIDIDGQMYGQDLILGTMINLAMGKTLLVELIQGNHELDLADGINTDTDVDSQAIQVGLQVQL